MGLLILIGIILNELFPYLYSPSLSHLNPMSHVHIALIQSIIRSPLTITHDYPHEILTGPSVIGVTGRCGVHPPWFVDHCRRAYGFPTCFPRHQMFLQEAGLETERRPGRAGDHALRHATLPGAAREDGDGWKINDGLYRWFCLRIKGRSEFASGFWGMTLGYLPRSKMI